MFNQKKKIGTGILTTAFGIIFLLAGITLFFFEVMRSSFIEWSGKQYTPHLFEYGYQFFGLTMAFIGVACLIFGIYFWQFKYTKTNVGSKRSRA